LPTLPLSVALSFVVMYLLGVDSNIMSLAGIAIAIGDVSDMGILMTENIYRRLALEPNRPRREVIYEAAVEIGRPMLTSVSNTIVAFIPVFALVGAEGKMFRPLAYTKTFAISASIILALTLVPVLCYYLLSESRWSRRRSLFVGLAAGVAAAVVTYLVLDHSFEATRRWSGWPTAV